MAIYTRHITEDGRCVIRRQRNGRSEGYAVPPDEYRWADSRSRIAILHDWYRLGGLARGVPHPMGKDLAAAGGGTGKELSEISNQFSTNHKELTQ